MIRTASQYYKAVQNIDKDKMLAEIERIPSNLNPTGKVYRKRLKGIIKKYDNRPKIR